MKNETYEKVKGWLEKEGIREMVSSSLGKSQEVDGWVNAALTVIGTDKEVLKAKAESILGAILEAATLGLRFEGPLGEAYLATRSKRDGKDDRGKWKFTTEAQLQIGYRGMMKLARRDPRVRKIEAVIVYENDQFEHQLGSEQFLRHTWDVTQPRGRMVAVYAAVRYHDGFYDFGQPYSMDAVMKHRDNILADKYIRVQADENGKETFFKVYDDGEKPMRSDEIRRTPWIAYIEAMVQKTAVRWSAKFWDLTPDFDRAAALISIDESGRSQHLEELVRRIIPESVLQPVPDAGGQKADGEPRVQSASLSRMGNLKAQMLREAGVRPKGDQEGPPAAEGLGAEEPKGEPAPAAEGDQGGDQEPEESEMTEAEQNEALERERKEAAAYEEERRRLAEADDLSGKKGNKGGRRGTDRG